MTTTTTTMRRATMRTPLGNGVVRRFFSVGVSMGSAKSNVFVVRVPRQRACALLVVMQLTRSLASQDKGVAEMNAGNLNEAIRLFDEALSVEANNVRAQMNRAVALHSSERRDESDVIFAMLLVSCQHVARLAGMCYYHLADSLLYKNEHDSAIETLKLGIEAMENGEMERGFEAAAAVVRARLHSTLGLTLLNQKRLVEAEQAWLAGVAAAPAVRDNYVSLARFYVQQQKLLEAKEVRVCVVIIYICFLFL